MGSDRKDRGGFGWQQWLAVAGLGVIGAVGVALSRDRRSLPAPAPPSPSPPEPAADEFWFPGPVGSLFLRRQRGDGAPPHLLVHGLGGGQGLWRPLQRLLAWRGVPSLALDLRGHGRSDPPPDGGWEVAALADDLAAAVEASGERRVVAVGHGLGAAVVAEYALRRPGRVAGIVLLDPVGDPTRLPEEDLSRLAEAVRESPREELAWSYRQLLVGAREDTAAAALGALRSTSPEVLAGLLVASLDYDPVPTMERLEVPVQLLSSPLNDLPHSLPRLLPRLPNRIFAGTSHWLMLDRPEAVAEALEDFLHDVLRWERR